MPAVRSSQPHPLSRTTHIQTRALAPARLARTEQLSNRFFERPAQLHRSKVRNFTIAIGGRLLNRLYSLAWCELYLIFGNIFRKLDMQLCSTRCAGSYSISASQLVAEYSMIVSINDLDYKTYLLPAYAGRLRARVQERRDPEDTSSVAFAAQS